MYLHRSVALATAILALSIGSSSHAINPPDDEGVAVLCIFTDPDAAMADNFLDPVTPGLEVQLYFVFYHPQQGIEALGGIEFAWHLDPEPPVPPTVLGWTWPPGSDAINITDDYSPVVGFQSGVPFLGSDHVTIGTLSLIFTVDPGVTSIYLGPVYLPSIPDEMIYTDWPSASLLLPMIPYSVGGLHTNPVFNFNEQGPIATAATTWGDMKSLFR